VDYEPPVFDPDMPRTAEFPRKRNITRHDDPIAGFAARFRETTTGFVLPVAKIQIQLKHQRQVLAKATYTVITGMVKPRSVLHHLAQGSETRAVKKWHTPDSVSTSAAKIRSLLSLPPSKQTLKVKEAALRWIERHRLNRCCDAQLPGYAAEPLLTDARVGPQVGRALQLITADRDCYESSAQ